MDNLKVTRNLKVRPEILTKNFFKNLASPDLARYLGKHVWGDLITGSVKSDIVEEAIKRLKNEVPHDRQ